MQYSRIEVGIDWVTQTVPRNHPQANDMYNEALQIMERLESEGNETAIGYKLGYAGVATGNNFVGSREDSYCVQFTSYNAQRYWRDVYRVGAHISRLDIQCTVFYTDNTDDYGEFVYETAQNAAKTANGKIKRKVNRYGGNDGGYTVYIGSKSSEHFVRIYDKGKESKNDAYKGSWRYELQLKNDYATQAASTLFLDVNGAHGRILAHIKSYLADRGVVTPWPCDGSETCLYTACKPKTDKDTALWWLAHQVRPALDKAKKLGYYKEALQALGVLEHEFEIVSRETGEIQQLGELIQG